MVYIILVFFFELLWFVFGFVNLYGFIEGFIIFYNDYKKNYIFIIWECEK